MGSPPMGLLPDLSLDGRVAIVTGASRGIGRDIAEVLVGAGAKVVLTARSLDGLHAARAELPADRVALVVGDAADDAIADRCVEHALGQFGRLDILVNNAGMNPPRASMADLDVSEIDKAIALNLRAPLMWSRSAYSHGFSSDGGVIINLASVGAYLSTPGMGVYGATKAGLVHLTRLLAIEMAPEVRVVGIAPSIVETDMARGLPDLESRVRSIPLGRIGSPRDISHLALYLCSSSASWITGQTIVIDGGRTLTY